MLSYRDGQLYSGPHALAEIAARVGTPYYLYSLDQARANLRRLQAAFPPAEVHYSLKANANLALLRALFAIGVGADCVSGGEVYRALAAGCPPSRIVFAGVGKSANELTYALSEKIGWFNVESGAELTRLNALAERHGHHARVALRINPDVQATTHQYIATGHAGAKFGISLDDARTILARAEQYTALQVRGVHVHIGSQLGDVEKTLAALRTALGLRSEFPFLEAINLGGGFPVSYTGEPSVPVEDFAAAILPLIEGRAQLLLEPGRYIVADAGVLVVRVEYVKPGPAGAIVVTDGGMTELIRPALYGAVHEVWSICAGERTVRAQVVGPVCESADVLRAEVMLPPVHEGDLLVIGHVGAYGAVMGSNYNARPRPPEVVIDGERWMVARRRETYEDLIRLEG